ncbi:GNS1/SUR4 family domain-containing protein, putative [Eimeria mitis]|uniref:Elongation of fatty acids protein n=1 Tax=Eimeria mitis TaxID=44415 RepID=U6K155_9EIME|nr:GNS1/SUR4 family domain-containing protein, putative [Eimeria mitis]CDJ31399.1 GNS1/SUR4 family domain-containing protein, putative [Eimeria mitis]
MSTRPAFSLRGLAFVWNLVLSLLSFLGFMTVLIQQPTLLTVPVHPERLFTPPVRVVVALFTLTKAVEFGDTFILVFKKKPLSFLHLYHHLTVTLYCWSAQHTNVDFAHGFVVMNLGVHSLMYLYYCLSCCVSAPGRSSSQGASGASTSTGTRSTRSSSSSSSGSSGSSRSLLQQVLRQSRPAITLMQIAQMIVGMYLATKGALCLQDQQQVLNAQIALAMYTSYAVLFLRLYCSSYLPHLSSNRVLLLFLLHALAAAGVYRLSCTQHKLNLIAHCAVGAVASLLLATICRNTNKKSGKGKDTNNSVWLSLLLALSLPCGLAVAAKQQEDEHAEHEAEKPAAAAASAATAATETAAAATPTAAGIPARAEGLGERCPSLTSTSADTTILSSCFSSSDDLGAVISKSPAAAASPDSAAGATLSEKKGKTTSPRMRPRGEGAMRQLTYKTASINLSRWQLLAAAAGAAAPMVYGQFVSGQWSVGVCVFGGLRWALELQAAHHLRLTA